MSEILISYRREDSPDVTGRIYDRLVQEFGKDWVFKDVDSIPFGVDFRAHLDEQVAKCHVFLAVMGPDWMKKGGKGKSSLEDTEDFIRIEIESALRRGIPVIPLFVRGMSMPKADRLPPSMENFAYRNGLNIRADPDFHRDMDRLIEDLRNNIEVLKAPRGWIGVVIEEPHPSYPNFWVLAERRVGVIIEDIIKEGPLHAAGLNRGDAIVEFDGIEVLNVSHLHKLTARANVGNDVDLKILRKDGTERSLKIKIGKKPAAKPTA